MGRSATAKKRKSCQTELIISLWTSTLSHCGLLYDPCRSTQCRHYNWRMTKCAGCCCGLLQAQDWHLTGGSEENYKKNSVRLPGLLDPLAAFRCTSRLLVTDVKQEVDVF